MGRQITTKKLAKNMTLSLVAQLISLAASFVFGMIVPRYIDEYQYSYWQMYLLYVGYVGVLHFGLLDGLVLRYSQYDYDELDKARLRSQFQLLLGFTSALAFLTCLASSFFLEGVTLWIVVLVAIGIITKNIFFYTSYTFQITNRITQYAILVILQKAVYAITVVILLLCKVNDFYWYCIADLMGDVVAIIIGACLNRGLYFGKALALKECFKESWLNISAGIMLMIANFSFGFLIGGAKMVIQWRWDELVFGKVAFSFSISNLFLTFVTAIGVVLFPSLKRMEEDQLPNLYVKIRDTISPLLFYVMLLYFPGCWILEMWLPAYSESLVYIGILLPIIIFSTKVSLLTNNYLKAYRKEKMMLLINVISVVIGFVLFLLGAYVFSSLDFVLYSTVFVIMLRSIASEVAVMKYVKKNFTLDYIVEFVMTVAFVAIVQLLSLWWACLAYFGVLVVYSVLYRKRIALVFKQVGGVLSKKKTQNSSVTSESAIAPTSEKDSEEEGNLLASDNEESEKENNESKEN